MLGKDDLWKMFEASGSIVFYNAYRALGEHKADGQKGDGDSDESGAL